MKIYKVTAAIQQINFSPSHIDTESLSAKLGTTLTLKKCCCYRLQSKVRADFFCVRRRQKTPHEQDSCSPPPLAKEKGVHDSIFQKTYPC